MAPDRYWMKMFGFESIKTLQLQKYSLGFNEMIKGYICFTCSLCMDQKVLLSLCNEKYNFLIPPLFFEYLSKAKVNQFFSYNQPLQWTRSVWRSFTVHLGESVLTCIFQIFIYRGVSCLTKQRNGLIVILWKWISFSQRWIDVCRLGNITTEPKEKLEDRWKQTSYVKVYHRV